MQKIKWVNPWNRANRLDDNFTKDLPGLLIIQYNNIIMCIKTNNKSLRSMSCLWKFTCFLSIALLVYVVLVSTCYHNIDSRASFVSTTQETEDLSYHRTRFLPFEISPNRSTYQIPEQNSPSRFLYLTQTEKCLPEYLLKSSDVIGDSTACQCDVLVLSFNEECKDTFLPHVKYVFRRYSTWTTGRNLLYSISKVREKFYLYNIFMDDDVKLRLLDSTLYNKNLWRVFEDPLRTIQPPIAAIDPWISFHGISNPRIVNQNM